MSPELEQQILQELSVIEHQQWMTWAKHILETEDVSDETRVRWEKEFIPYGKLPPEVQALDRPFAQRSLEVFKKYL